MANYQYQTIYGVEPFDLLSAPIADSFGGGAKITKNNLLITLWNLPGFDPALNINPVAGELMRPFPETPLGETAIAGSAAGGVFIEKGFDQVFNSRYSTRFYIKDENIGTEEEPVYELSEYLLAVLQPPQDMVNDWLTYVTKNLSAAPLNIDFLRSFFYPLTWSFRAFGTDFTVISDGASFGGFFNIAGSFTILTTNGADGTFPVFSASTFDGLVQQLKNVTSGKPFYIPCIFSRSATFESETAEMFEISWPGSNARR